MEFQSTLPRRERHESNTTVHLIITISIHAPTKGATGKHVSQEYVKSISIHAPTKGATRHCLNQRRLTRIFQSTLPRRERLWAFTGSLFFSKISIHAPTKGATIPVLLSCFRDLISIHAPTKGATSLFSLLPHKVLYFNPRSHEGSDERLSFSRWFQDISIHAPTKGATYWNKLKQRLVAISIHAPTKGATTTICTFDK